MIALLFTALALADAIDAAPDDCPAGAIGTTSHCGTDCVPYDCPLDDCPAGYTCAPAAVCVEHTTRRESCGRVQDSPMVPYERVTGACSTDADCTGGAKCETAVRCTPATSRLCGFATIAPLMLGLLALGAAKPRRS